MILRILQTRAVDETYQYPPELFSLLVDGISVLFRNKDDVIGFFRGAGVPSAYLQDLVTRVQTDRDAIRKTEIARTVLQRINEAGDPGLRCRREIVRRVTDFEDFSSTWPEERDRAENLVGRIRHVVNVKDSFTRIEIEREREVRARRQVREADLAAARLRIVERSELKAQLQSLFKIDDPHRRGKLLEPVLTQLFTLAGCRVLDAFEVRAVNGLVIEQIDGLVELDGQVYLVEAKWYAERLGVAEIAPALVRVFGRGQGRAVIVSASGFTGPAIEQVRDALRQSVVVLAELSEVVLLLERDGDPAEWLREKVRAAIAHKEALYRP